MNKTYTTKISSQPKKRTSLWARCFGPLLRSISVKNCNFSPLLIEGSDLKPDNHATAPTAGQIPSVRNVSCRIGALLTLLLLVLTVPLANANSPDQPTTNTELQQAIKKLTARAGPPGAYSADTSSLSPLALIQTSLWQRLRNNFEFNQLTHPTIEAQIEFMQQGLQSLTSNLNRSRDILFYIVDEIDRAGLPLDIALLPLVESAFDPMAMSSHNAAGLWQFIPATADDYGLMRNQWYDGRNDLVDSTHAAIRYLKKLHKTFKGDWLLALAAYNTGPGNVRQAMQRARDNGLEPHFWNLRLAKETRDYVPRLIAVNKMISDPGFYGLYLPELLNRKIIDTIAVGRPLSLDLAAELAGTTETRMRELNPGYLQGDIPLGGPYHLTVPAETSRQLLAELNVRKLSLSNPAKTPQANSTEAAHQPRHADAFIMPRLNSTSNTTYKPYKKYVYQTHTVKSGDNLWNIARSMDTTVDALLEWNGKEKDAAKLQLGEKMIVAYLDKKPSGQSNQKLINYRVTATDTLITVTDHFNVSISALKKWNPALWQKNYLQAGQAIKIPIQTSSGY